MKNLTLPSRPLHAPRRLSILVAALTMASASHAGFSDDASEKAAESRSPALFSVEVGSKYIHWDTGHSETGRQSASPVALAYETPRVSLGMKGMYLSSHRHYDINNALWGGSKAGWTDTSFAAAVRGHFDPYRRWQVRVEANAPTGDSSLTGREKNVVANHLFLERIYWGEGPNVQLDGTLTQAVGDNLALSGTLAMTRRGAYHHDGDRPDVKLDPGEQASLSMNLAWKGSSSLMSLTGRYVHEDETRLDGDAVHERGDAFEVALYGNHQIEKWTLSGALFHATRRNDRVLDPMTGRLDTEEDRSAAPLTSAFVGVDYAWSDAWSFGATARRARAGENEYDITSARFLPERQLTAGEVYATWKPTKSSLLRFSAGRFRQVDRDPLNIEDSRYRGHTVGVTYRVMFDR